MSYNKILIVGGGNMGAALYRAFLASPSGQDRSYYIVEPAAALYDGLKHSRAVVCASIADLPADARPELVILAVKPQLVGQVLSDCRVFGVGVTYVSVAAGVTLTAMERFTGRAPLFRAIPNTPVSVRRGVTVLCANEHALPVHKQMVSELFEASGSTFMVDDENKLDIATAISGSGPAYVFYFMECMLNAAVALGLPKEMAQKMTLETVAGAAAFAGANNEEFADLRAKVTSPNGTTEAALKRFTENDGLSLLIREAVGAARLRSAELGNLAEKT